jgi:predicted nucleic acid-binding protein
VIILDTGPVVAMVNAGDDDHARCVHLLTTYPGRLLLPEPLLGEVGYLLGTRCGAQAEAAFLRDTVGGPIEVVSLTDDDRSRSADLVEKYGNLPLGLRMPRW